MICDRLEDKYWAEDVHYEQFLDDFERRVAEAAPIVVGQALIVM